MEKQRIIFILILKKTDFFSSHYPTYPKDSLGLTVIIGLRLVFEVRGLDIWISVL